MVIHIYTSQPLLSLELICFCAILPTVTNGNASVSLITSHYHGDTSQLMASITLMSKMFRE